MTASLYKRYTHKNENRKNINWFGRVMGFWDIYFHFIRCYYEIICVQKRGNLLCQAYTDGSFYLWRSIAVCELWHKSCHILTWFYFSFWENGKQLNNEILNKAPWTCPQFWFVWIPWEPILCQTMHEYTCRYALS